MSSQGTVRNGQPAGFGLIETLRWEPAAGFVRLHQHLARLRDSADELGIGFDEAEIRSALDGAVKAATTPLRVRALLASDGSIDVTTLPFVPLALDAVWRLAIAETRLDSADPLLRHKTTHRALYEAARAEVPKDTADEVLLLNERGELCEGSFTTLFMRHKQGPWLTPALNCGLLAGVLRAEMLQQGAAQEAVLMPADLVGAEVAVGNSLRGLIRAEMA